MTTASCRLFLIVAREAERALILRRGPSAWYHLVRWDLQHDSFEMGAWLQGRIYEEKCDLSPDGNLLLYTAYRTIRIGDQFFSSYTALSRAPWLHALAIWPQDSTHNGGGRFVDNRQLCLAGVLNDPVPPLPATFSIVPGDTPRQRSADLVPGSDWSGLDHRGRIIFTMGGKVFRRTGKSDHELADFNSLTPHPQPPPVWAKRAM